MPQGFRVYIDESGDEGFIFTPGGGGSSRWFVLSAVVTREETDLTTVKLVDQVRSELGKPARSSLHFRNLKHEQRLPFVARIASARVRVVNVLVHKPSILEPEKFMATPHLLYRYVTRYLLERVSWLCRDARRSPEQYARVIFSNRSCMSYDAIRNYLDGLKEQTGDFDVRIDWSVINSANIESQTHDRLMGLQIADAVASSFFMGVELNRYGYNEWRYAQMLKPVVYRHQQRYLGHGLKFWPRDVSGIEQPHLNWLEYYGAKK